MDEHSDDNNYRTSPVNDDDSEVDEVVRLDLGIDLHVNSEKKNTFEAVPGPSSAAMNEVPKREDNPFSFKHFLRNNSTNYRSQGARPKVYCDGRPVTSISDLDLHQTVGGKQTRVVPEFSSALPDFVQDHLVVEQCYLGEETSRNDFGLNLDRLPDFAPNRNNTHNLIEHSSRNLERRSDSTNNLAIPLDLPVRPPAGFPLDLPIAEPSGSRSCPSSTEVGVSKSLPDFLADGAVRTQNNEPGNGPNQSPVREIDQVRHEMEMYRLQMFEHKRRQEALQRELEVAHSKEDEYTHNLVRALEQVEENLERSNRRAASAENTVIKLKQEIKSLKNEINMLQRENSALKGNDEGAAGGPNLAMTNDSHSQRLAHELRAAANTAELSLRQLLNGVDNLRMMASTLENKHRIEERTDTLLDLDDETGPAL